MSQLQDVFNRIQKSKKEQRELKLMYKDALSHHQELQKIIEEAKSLRDRKKKIEESVKEDFSSEFNKLDTLKLDIENDQMLLADAAITKLMKGELVEIVDERDQRYEPVFSVKFKKS